MKAISVDKKMAEKVKQNLIKTKNLDGNYKVRSEGNSVYFPVFFPVKNHKILDVKFEKKNKVESFENLLKNEFDEKELSELKKAYEVVGDIAILEVDEKFSDKEKLIANALLKSNKNIKTVVSKEGNYEGEFRLRKHKYLAGVKKDETVHKENNIRVKLNIDTCYFSARLANERLIIANQVKDGEKVLVMFSGVGVFALVIAKNAKPKEVYSIEINPEACKYADENIKLNKIKNMNSFCGDVRKIVPKFNEKFDRIVMPHPHDALSFLDVALSVLKKKGVIHLYAFYDEDKMDEIWKEIDKYIKHYKKIGLRTCCQVCPGRYRICADFQIL